MAAADVDAAGKTAQQNSAREQHRLSSLAAKAKRQQKQHRERRFQGQGSRVVIPEAGAAARAEQVGGVSGRVVRPERLEAGKESRRRES